MTPPRLQEKYRNEVAPGLLREFAYKSPMAVPRIAAVKLNMGMGKAIGNSRLLDSAVAELASIAGQKPVVTKARKPIAAFKLREGVAIGCTTTLRGTRMWEFIDRLLSVALPRVRDFSGVSPKLDGRGNYTLGIREHAIFPEIDYTKVDEIKGMNVTFITTATTDQEGFRLLKLLGMPFRS